MARRTTRRRRFAGWGGWLLAVLIGLDQFGNVLFGGDPDDTISARCGATVEAGGPAPVCRSICWALDKLDEGHCENAQE